MKNTKKALLMTVMSLLICISMLVGTTFAWFTDSVSTGENIIAAGNLDVELYWSADCATWKQVDENTNVFEDSALWEPGHTEVVYLKVANEGTLHLKYQLGVNVVSEVTSTAKEGGELKLSEHIMYGVAETDSKYADRTAARAALTSATALEDDYGSEVITLAPKGKTGDSETVALVVYMPEEVGNEANHAKGAVQPTINLGLNVFATQVEAEGDSFGSDYDAAAPYDLPSGVSAEDFGDNVALVNGTYYATVQAALQAVHEATMISTTSATTATEPVVMYLKPNANVGNLGHAHICTSMTIYGNDAYATGGDFELDTWMSYPNGNSTCDGINEELTLTIDGMDGISVWGERKTANTLNINLIDCQNMDRVYISGTVAVNNYSIEGSSFVDAVCSVYSNANGIISVKDTSFTNVGEPINLNHKVSGTQTINIEGCDFINCGNMSVDTSLWAASIRVLSSAAGAKSVLTVKDVTFTGAQGTKLNGDIVLNDTITSTVAGTVSATLSVPADAVVVAYTGAVVDGATTTAPAEMVAAKDTAALENAINGADEHTFIALAKGEYKMPSVSGAKEITIVGTEDTVIDVTVGAYLDKSKVSFEGVTIKGSTGYVYDANGNKGSDYAALYTPNVTYTNCTFDGPFRIGRDGATFVNCTFNNLGNDYIWTYGNDATFENCTFNSEGKALLIYSDGGSEVSKVVVKDCVFNATKGAKAGAIANQNCAAIEIQNYGNGVELTTSGNTVDSDFSGEWRIKSYHANNPAVIVNGVTYTSIAVDGKTMTIDNQSNVTIN